MSEALIRKAFESTLKTWADAQTPAIPVAWENVSFTPPAGRYARAFVLPSTKERLFLEGGGRMWKGLFQVSLCMTQGAGAGGAEALVASLDTAFASDITVSGLRVYLISPMSQSLPIQEPDRFVIPVTARYEAVAA